MYTTILLSVVFLGQVELTKEQQRVLELTHGQQQQVLTNEQRARLKVPPPFVSNKSKEQTQKQQALELRRQQEAERLAWYKQQKFEEAYADAQARKWRIRNLPSPWAVGRAYNAYYINWQFYRMNYPYRYGGYNPYHYAIQRGYSWGYYPYYYP